MADNDFPVRMAGQRMRLTPAQLERITPLEISQRLRYQQTFPTRTQ